MKIEDLPKNKWILGNIKGTVFERKKEKGKIVTMRYLNKEHKRQTKTFRVENYGDSVERTYLEARKYLINVSHHKGLVNNRIKILDDYIEIEGKHGNTLTDYVFLPLFMPSLRNLYNTVTICKKQGGESDMIYSSAYIRLASDGENLFSYHGLIMGASFIDHIDRNPLNNQLSNLCYSNHQHNATNRGPGVKDTGGIYGVRKDDQYYLACVKSNEITYKKEFSIEDLGKKKAKLHCILFCEHVLKVNLSDANIEKIEYDETDIDTIKFAIKQYTAYEKLHSNKVVEDPEEYMSIVKSKYITRNILKKMYEEYIIIQINRTFALESKIEQLKNILHSIQPTKKTAKETVIEI